GRYGSGSEEGGMPQDPGAAGGAPPAKNEAKQRIVEIDKLKLETNPNARLAEKILPMRMAIVAGSFPYREQVREFQNKLRVKTPAELYADERSMPQFLGFKVERMTVGQPGAKWEPVNVDRDFEDLVNFYTGMRFEPDDPGLKTLMVDGLVMARPQLFRDDL